MPVWKSASVDHEPTTTLVSWQVMAFANGERSFVGYAVESREGRVSSAVVTFDVKALRGVTRSGRVYQLRGRPGVDSDAAYLWRRYVSGHDDSTWTDVTASVWLEHATALEADAASATSSTAGSAGVVA
jgi:hypothetical protein